MVAEALAIAALVLALGRWAGSVSSALREIKDAVRHVTQMAEGLGGRVDRDRDRNAGDHTRLWMAQTQSVGRIETLERLAGLPPPWKRTQPIMPVDPAPEQDMFRPEDEQP